MLVSNSPFGCLLTPHKKAYPKEDRSTHVFHDMARTPMVNASCLEPRIAGSWLEEFIVGRGLGGLFGLVVLNRSREGVFMSVGRRVFNPSRGGGGSCGFVDATNLPSQLDMICRFVNSRGPLEKAAQGGTRCQSFWQHRAVNVTQEYPTKRIGGHESPPSWYPPEGHLEFIAIWWFAWCCFTENPRLIFSKSQVPLLPHAWSDQATASTMPRGIGICPMWRLWSPPFTNKITVGPSGEIESTIVACMWREILLSGCD